MEYIFSYANIIKKSKFVNSNLSRPLQSFWKVAVQQYLGINITVNNIQGNWKGLYPSIKINIDEDPSEINKSYSFPELVLIDFNIYKSILIFKPVIKKLYAENISYKNNYKNFILLLNSRNNKNYIILESLEFAKSNIIITEGKNLLKP